MRRVLPLLLALSASGCGGCVDEPSGGNGGSSATSPGNPNVTPQLKPNPLLRNLRPVMHLAQGADDGAAPASPQTPPTPTPTSTGAEP